MKNIELINRINYLSSLLQQEKTKTVDERWFEPKHYLIINRNLRAMSKDYEENYAKELEKLNKEFYEEKEEEVTILADEEKGIEEHTEKQTKRVLREGKTEEDFQNRLAELLNFDGVDVPILKLKQDDIAKVMSIGDIQMLDFMVE
jgi:hypothetical protein